MHPSGVIKPDDGIKSFSLNSKTDMRSKVKIKVGFFSAKHCGIDTDGKLCQILSKEQACQ